MVSNKDMMAVKEKFRIIKLWIKICIKLLKKIKILLQLVRIILTVLGVSLSKFDYFFR